MSIENIGLIASFTAILMFVSPIAQIKDILKDKTSHRISPLMYGMMVINCFFWVVYGLGVEDIYIIIPNIIGAFLGLTTFIVIYKYRK